MNKICASCGKNLTKVAGVGGFWEGGKGTTDKANMSSKDSHKFKGSKNKTVSNKKKSEILKK